MQLKTIYQKDIDRKINGVVKVAQEDDENVRQELEEYIITKELRKNFSEFIDSYQSALSEATDRIGVWITGFFGSGKSHFLKILSYLLSNKKVPDETGREKRALDYFEEKFEEVGDGLEFLKWAESTKTPADTILFNIDAKNAGEKSDNSILQVFAKVFYDYLGYYGSDLKIVKLEKFIEAQGKTVEFRNKFKEINGEDWISARPQAMFFADDLVETLTAVMGMSEAAAQNWADSKDEVDISIEDLVADIRDYVSEKPKDYRLLFMVDEIGQFIGSNGSLMLNLQTIVEEIGSKCGGKVWVVVTSQEAIDSITKMNSIAGNDFSKIQGRFNTRLSLSSSSVDEVIKKRILKKTPSAQKFLEDRYAGLEFVLGSLLGFSKDTVLEIKTYKDKRDFADTYPFVPYQFRLFQEVLAQIRAHGNTGMHLSGGERSMLSGFQEAAQATENKDENALVPFDLFYDTIHTFLESPVRRVIDICESLVESGDLKPFDLRVLKLLYLIRYVDKKIKATPENIAALMADDVNAQKAAITEDVKASLDRLLAQNYITRQGDRYIFLTNEEQEIERQIKNTAVDGAQITKRLGEILFNDLYDYKKFRYENIYDFGFDRKIDETMYGKQENPMTLRFITIASDERSPQELAMSTGRTNEVIIVLSEKYSYYEELEKAEKIRKFVQVQRLKGGSEPLPNIINEKQAQAAAYEQTARDNLDRAIAAGTIYVGGSERGSLKGSGNKDKINKALGILVQNVYTGLDYIGTHTRTSSEIAEKLKKAPRSDLEKAASLADSANKKAIDEVIKHIELQHNGYKPASVGDIKKLFTQAPYGWLDMDIAGILAELLAARRINIKLNGEIVNLDDRALPSILTDKKYADSALIERHVEVSEDTRKKVKAFLRDYTENPGVPEEEEPLAEFAENVLREGLNRYLELKANYSSGVPYPGRDIVETGIKLNSDALDNLKKSNSAFLEDLKRKQENFLDLKEDSSSLFIFFDNQKKVFDSAYNLKTRIDRDKDYWTYETELGKAMKSLNDILSMKEPYGHIPKLNDLYGTVLSNYNELLAQKRQEKLLEIQAAMADVHNAADTHKKDIVDNADKEFAKKKRDIEELNSLTELDAMSSKINSLTTMYLKKLMTDPSKVDKTKTINRLALFSPEKLKSNADIESYVAELREKLYAEMTNYDELHII